MSRDENQKTQPKADYQAPEQAAMTHGRVPHPRPAFTTRPVSGRTIRRGSSVMIRRRSLALNVGQSAISLSVRPQPMHSPEAGSIVHTLVQGVSTEIMGRGALQDRLKIGRRAANATTSSSAGGRD
jgi:hypothetical protein